MTAWRGLSWHSFPSGLGGTSDTPSREEGEGRALLLDFPY